MWGGECLAAGCDAACCSAVGELCWELEDGELALGFMVHAMHAGSAESNKEAHHLCLLFLTR